MNSLEILLWSNQKYTLKQGGTNRLYFNKENYFGNELSCFTFLFTSGCNKFQIVYLQSYSVWWCWTIQYFFNSWGATNTIRHLLCFRCLITSFFLCYHGDSIQFIKCTRAHQIYTYYLLRHHKSFFLRKSIIFHHILYDRINISTTNL